MTARAPRPSSFIPISPLRENWVGVVFMVCLLLVAGITATVVGYRVKRADWDRKAQLLAAYEALGGNFETLMTPSQTIISPQLSHEQQVFVTTYEVNQRAREYGVFTVIDNTPREKIDFVIKSLAEIGASEASRTIDDTIKALDRAQQDSALQAAPAAATPSGRERNSAAQRYARQYRRPMSRETEAKLFQYYHRNQIKIDTTPNREALMREAPTT